MLEKLVESLFKGVKKRKFGKYYLIYDRSCMVHIEGRLELECHTYLGMSSVVNIADGAILSIGKNVCFSRGVLIAVPSGCKISILDNVKIGAFSELHGDISIGENTLIAPFLFASSGSHNYPLDSQSIRELDQLHPIPSRPITIGENCWICHSTHIFPGRHIGRCSIVSASTIVVFDVPPNSLLKSHQSYSIKSLG